MKKIALIWTFWLVPFVGLGALIHSSGAAAAPLLLYLCLVTALSGSLAQTVQSIRGNFGLTLHIGLLVLLGTISILTLLIHLIFIDPETYNAVLPLFLVMFVPMMIIAALSYYVVQKLWKEG